MSHTGHALAALNPRAELRVVDRCGLLSHDERAEDFVALILPFLTEEARPASPDAPDVATRSPIERRDG